MKNQRAPFLGVRKTVLNEVVMLGADFYEEETLLTPPSAGGPEPLPSLGIGRGCRNKLTIIDKNARIGDGVIIRMKKKGETSRDRLHWVRDEVTVIPKGAVIPAGTAL